MVTSRLSLGENISISDVILSSKLAKLVPLFALVVFCMPEPGGELDKVRYALLPLVLVFFKVDLEYLIYIGF